MSKLSLDRDTVDLCRKMADQVVAPILHYVDRHSSVSIERCVLRLMGVEGAAEEKPKDPAPQGRFPLVNELVSKIGPQRLARGAGYWLALASAHHPKLQVSTLARKIASGEIDLDKLPPLPFEKVDPIAQILLQNPLGELRKQGEKKALRPAWRLSSAPLRYVIVATGNIHEDIWQAQAAAEMGADIIAVIRSTAQSLLDYVPEGATTEGFGGTYATQENFRLMREALHQSEKKLKRRIGLTNYSSGLCMPEIALLGATEGLDYLLNDAMYGILFRDINPRRNFVDQHFSRRICALSDITIQTGEDNYLTTADSHKYWHQVLASHFINYAFARKSGLPEESIALGHAYEMDPRLEDSIIFEWAQAQLVREIFPRCPIKFMPPTKHMTGDVFFGYLYDGLFNLAGILTGQSIQLLGMHTEAIHNPFVQDRYLSLKNAEYVFNGAKSVRDEVYFQPNGKIARRARQVLDDSLRMLKKIKDRSLWRAIEEGAFANVRRVTSEGKGKDGVFEKSREYYTPLAKYLTPRLPGEREDLMERYRATKENLRQRREQVSGRSDRGGRRDRQDRRPRRGGREDPRGARREDRQDPRRSPRTGGERGSPPPPPAALGSAPVASDRPPAESPSPALEPAVASSEVVLLAPPILSSNAETANTTSEADAQPAQDSPEEPRPRSRRRRGGRGRRGGRRPRGSEGGGRSASAEGAPAGGEAAPIYLPERASEANAPAEAPPVKQGSQQEGNEG